MKFFTFHIAIFFTFCNADDAFNSSLPRLDPSENSSLCKRLRMNPNTSTLVSDRLPHQGSQMKFFTFYIWIFSALCSADDTFSSPISLSRLEQSEKPGSCILPNATDDKGYVANCDQNFPVKPGERVPEGIALWFVCSQGYGRDKGKNRFRSVCSNGSWFPPIHQCLRKCGKPPILDGIKYKCYYGNKETECNGEYLAGTKLSTSCSLPYHHPNHMETVCDEFGEWNVNENTKCVADCGMYSEEAKLLYKDRYLPWHVLIKRHAITVNDTNKVWSGTLIAPNLVISVSIYFLKEDGFPIPPEHFEVLVNGFVNEEHQKLFKVKHINYHKKLNTITILHLAEKVEISATVMPVCINWNDIWIPSKQPPSAGKIVEVGDLAVDKTTRNEVYLLNSTTDDSQTCNSTPKEANMCTNESIQKELQDLKFCLQNAQGPPSDNNSLHKSGEKSTPGGGCYVENTTDHLYYLAGLNIVHHFFVRPDCVERVSFFINLVNVIEWVDMIYKGIDAVDNIDIIEHRDCGKYSDDAKDVYQSKYLPWHVLIKNNFYNNIYSGTLIAPNLVLTVKALVTLQNNETIPVKYLEVVANGFLDKGQQKTYKIKELYTSHEFFQVTPKKELSHLIAVLHLMEDVAISPTIQPVCVDWTGVNLAPTFLPLTGKVVRIGNRTTLSPVRNETHIVNMETLNLELCKWSAGWHSLTYDAFCAENKGSTVFRNADLGGGYYVENPKDGLFYIRGTSVFQVNDERFIPFIDVAKDIEWLNAINKKINDNNERNAKPSISSARVFHRPLSDFKCESDELNRCYLVPQYNIVITQVICAKSKEKCLIHSSNDDITALSETKIQYKCKNGYFLNSTDINLTTTNMTTTCQRYKWFPPISQCHPYTEISHKSNIHWENRTIWTSPIFAPECGKSSNAIPLIWNGNKAKLGEFPWHAAIYRNEGEKTRKPICGATIISSRYLLSAAHCFVNTENTAKMGNSSDFHIMVGLIKSQHDSKEDYKQRHEITDIIIKSYGGEKYRHQNDVAILMTKSEITFNPYVAPICLINNFFPYIPERTTLWVAGWGLFNSSRIQNENLVSLEVPFISYEECLGNPNYSELSNFLTPEKFCITRKEGMEKSLDEGDSGGGLVAKGPNNAYYLVGIVSLSVKNSVVVLCTYVPQFHKWISEVILDHSNTHIPV